MKKYTFLTIILAAVIAIGFQHAGYGQLLLNENFDYVTGTQLTANGWTQTGTTTTNPILVSATGLSYTGYLSSGIGKAADMVTTGQDVNNTFTQQSAGTVYAGFLVSVAATQTAGDYFFHFIESPVTSNTFKARVFVKKDAITNNFAFGISKSSSSVGYTNFTYSPNTTYLIVVKYQFLTGSTTDDVISLYINPLVGAPEPGFPEVQYIDNTQADANNLGLVGLRQGSTSNAGTLTIDGIRIGLTWADVIGGVAVVPPTVQAHDIAFSGVTSNTFSANWTNGDGAKRVAIINTSNTFTNPADGTDPAANTVYGGSGQQVIFNGSGNTVAVTGLSQNTIYWLRVFEYNGTGSSTKFLTTTATLNPNSQQTAILLTAPVITLPTVTGISNSTALLGATISNDGGSPITERGTVWNTLPGVTISDNKLAEGGTATGVFTHSRSLPAQTHLYFKAYATNVIGTSLTTEDSFFTLSDEPGEHVTGFTAVAGSNTSINLTWTAAASGASGYMILQKTGAVAPTGVPTDATAYSEGTTLGDGVVAAIVTPGSALNKTIIGLSPGTQYSFSIFPYAWDAVNSETINYYTTPVVPTASATTTGSASVVYTWQGADNGSWAVATNWNPTRSVPAPGDILQFNDGTTKTITGVIAQSIAKLVIANNTIINLQSAAAATLTVTGAAGTDLDIPAGCALNMNATNAISIVVATTATASISGNIKFSSTASTAHRLTGADPGSITFNSGAVFTAGTFFSGNPFGTSSLNSVIFTAGSSYLQQAGSNPFGAGQPNSVVVFQTGSLFKVMANLTPSFSGRTYANFEMDATGITLSPTGTAAVSIDNLTITNGTFNFNMTGPASGFHQIKGNIQVQTSAILTFSPSAASTVTLAGTTPQSITVNGTLTTSGNLTLEVANSAGITLNSPVTVNGNLELTSGFLSLGSSNLILSPTSTIIGTPSVSAMIVATGTGKLQKGFTAGYTGSFEFPVGDVTGTPEYSPVTLTFSSGTFAAGNYIAVNLANAKFAGDPNTTSYLNRYWNVSSSAVTAFNCSATFQYVPADVTGNELQVFSMQVVPSPFTEFGLTNAGLHQVTATGLTAFGTFTGSQPKPLVQTNPATLIGATTATLNGEVIARYNTTAVSFEYGLTTAYGSTGTAIPASVTGGGTSSILANITGLTQNTTYHFRVNGTNVQGTANGNDLTFTTLCPTPSTAGNISGPANVCKNGTGYVYTVPAVANATSYTWTLPAGATITSGVNSNSITVSFSGVAVSGSITVYGTSVCGAGAASPAFAVTVIPQPVPTVTGPASACINSTGNVYTTEAGMSGYSWTVSGGGAITGGTGTNSITVTWSATGPNSVTASYTNASGCATATPTSYAVNVVAIPVPTITGPSVVCANAANIVYTTEPGMTGYNWAVSIGGTIISGAGTNAITVSWPYAGNRTVSVTYTNQTGCVAITPTIYNVTINPAAVPTIGSSNNPCINSTNNQYLTNTGMTNYTWNVSAGGTITSGQGTSTINVTWNSVGAQWVNVSYTNSYGCSSVTPTVYNLFVNPVPNAAGVITGTAAVCAGTNGVAYSCEEIMNATSYTWALPTGATIASGAGTRNITVNFGPGSASGNITVAGTNSCGNGTLSPAFAVTVNPLPSAAGTINGPSSVCAGSGGVVFSVPSISGATSYVWTVPSGATITSGSATNSITVSFNLIPASGFITVKGSNTCGTGAVSPNFSITVNALPATPVVTVNGSVLTSSATSGNQWYYNSNPIAGATSQTYTVTNNTGYYWCVVTLNGCSSAVSNKIWMVITGQEEMQGSSFKVYPVPNNGTFNISITTTRVTKYTLAIYSQLGAKVYEADDLEVDGTFERVVDLRPIPAGVYSAVLSNEGARIVRKIVIAR
jgi:hypothetical protein